MKEQPGQGLEAPAAVPRLEAPGGLLVRASPARRRPFVIATTSSSMEGDEMDGVGRVDLSARTVLEGLRSGAGTCSNVAVGPSAIRRELVGPGGSVMETAFLSDRPRGAVLQWRAAAEGGLALDVAWRTPWRGASWHASGGVLSVGTEGEESIAHALVPAPERWRVEPGPGGLEVEARVRSAEGSVTLLTVRGAVDRLGELLDRLARVDVHEARAERIETEGRESTFALHTGVAALDEGLEWAKARLRTAAPDAPPGADPWTTMGLLAAGEHAAARRRLTGAIAGPEDLLAMGELVRWTGDHGLVRARIGDIDDVVSTLMSTPRPGGADAVLLEAAMTSVADAAEAAGFRLRATAWRQAARAGGAGTAGPARGVSLPVVGARNPGEMLRAALLPSSRPVREPAEAPADAEERALRAWALFGSGRPDVGYLHLRRHLESMPEEAFPGTTDAAGLAVLATLQGMLGARPDASYGRLRIAPALPANWARLEARSIRLGDATLDLAYERDGPVHAFTLTPTGGRIPATVVFEPSLPAGVVSAAEVDGAPAEVDVTPGDERCTARLQLPVDRVRRVSLVVADG